MPVSGHDPLRVPAQFWQRQDVTEALNARDIELGPAEAQVSWRAPGQAATHPGCRAVPEVTDVELARANPALAVFSAICHGGADVDAAFPALAQALRALGPKSAILYHDIVLAGLPPDPRARWEAYMSAATGSEYRSELLREADARGRALGKAQGEGQAVLTVLDARGVPVSQAIREQILACTDLTQLDTWLRRAVIATTDDEVIQP